MKSSKHTSNTSKTSNSLAANTHIAVPLTLHGTGFFDGIFLKNQTVFAKICIPHIPAQKAFDCAVWLNCKVTNPTQQALLETWQDSFSAGQTFYVDFEVRFTHVAEVFYGQDTHDPTQLVTLNVELEAIHARTAAKARNTALPAHSKMRIY
jgi:hypothetical protein